MDLGSETPLHDGILIYGIVACFALVDILNRGYWRSWSWCVRTTEEIKMGEVSGQWSVAVAVVGPDDLWGRGSEQGAQADTWSRDNHTLMEAAHRRERAEKGGNE